MKGLIYKDWCIFMQKNNLLSTIISIFIFVSIVFVFQNFYGLALCVLLSLPLGGASFAQMAATEEEKTNMNDWVVAMPFSKSEIVRARFYSGLLIFGFFEVISFLIMLYYVGIVDVTSLFTGLLVWFAGFVLGIIFFAVNTFSYYLLGAQKGNIVFFIMMVLSIIAYLALHFWIGLENLLSLGTLPLMCLSAVIGFALLGVSYVLCVKLFERKYL